MKFIFLALLAVAMIYGFRERLAQSNKDAWQTWARKTMASAIKSERALNTESLLSRATTACEVELTKLFANSSCNDKCRTDTLVQGKSMAETLREIARFTEEEERKIMLIELAIKNLEASGITRADFKSFFRSEILEEEDEDKKAAEEAQLSIQERSTGRFNW